MLRFRRVPILFEPILIISKVPKLSVYESGLIIQKHSILGILGTHVPVHPGHVLAHVAFYWHVPVHVEHVPVHVGLW